MLQLVVEAFTQRNFVADFIRLLKLNFIFKNTKNRFLTQFLKDLGYRTHSTYSLLESPWSTSYSLCLIVFAISYTVETL